jgi:hypothetical protein
MARMGHDNVRAVLIYQQAVGGGADKAITDAIDAQLNTRDRDDGAARCPGARKPIAH